MSLSDDLKKRLALALTKQSASNELVELLNQALAPDEGGGGGAEQISDDTAVINWTTAGESAGTNSTLFLRKVGDVVTMTMAAGDGSGFTKSGNGNVFVAGSIPAAFRSAIGEYVTVPVYMSVSGVNAFGMMIVYLADGSVDFYKTQSEGGFVGGEIVQFPYGLTVSWIKKDA